jgi:hypothetical protein
MKAALKESLAELRMERAELFWNRKLWVRLGWQMFRWVYIGRILVRIEKFQETSRIFIKNFFLKSLSNIRMNTLTTRWSYPSQLKFGSMMDVYKLFTKIKKKWIS